MVEAVKAAEKHKFGKHLPPHRRMHPGAHPMDSEECTETSEEEEEEEEEEEDEEEDEATLLEEADLDMSKKKERLVGLKRDSGGKALGMPKAPEEMAQKKARVLEEDETSESDKKLNESSEIEVYGQVCSMLVKLQMSICLLSRADMTFVVDWDVKNQ